MAQEDQRPQPAARLSLVPPHRAGCPTSWSVQLWSRPLWPRPQSRAHARGSPPSPPPPSPRSAIRIRPPPRQRPLGRAVDRAGRPRGVGSTTWDARVGCRALRYRSRSHSCTAGGRLVVRATQSMVAHVLIEAVVTDLDGTLVRADFSMSPATLEALDRIHAAGIRFLVATARTPQGLECLGVPANRVDVAVCCSGSIGWSPQQRTQLWRELVMPSAVARVVEIAEVEGAGVASFDGALWRMTQEYARLSPDQPHGTTRVVVDPAALAAAPCCTMAVRHADGDLTRIAELVASQGGDAALSHVGRSTVLDVTGSGVDKGTGTVRALAMLGIEPESAISFGDMPNDLSMFRVTGRSYSVGAVHPEGVRAAHEVVADVQHDGFARKIAELAGAGWQID